MYVPSPFRLNDPAAVAEIIRDYNFALLVTADGGVPEATHIPVMFDRERGALGTLIGHVARANPQASTLRRLAQEHGEALIVFQGAHGYISPAWYEDPTRAVPTWNYVAVHAYGTPSIIGEEGRVLAMLQRLVDDHEATSPVPWRLDQADGDYVRRLLGAIVAFEIPLTRLDTKAKLSQNRTAVERERAVAGLRAAEDPHAQALADWMNRCVPDR